MTFFLGGHFDFFFSKNKFFLLHLIKKSKGFHMRCHFFLYCGWFLQNLRKDFIRTNMQTTVDYAQWDLMDELGGWSTSFNLLAIIAYATSSTRLQLLTSFEFWLFISAIWDFMPKHLAHHVLLKTFDPFTKWSQLF